MIDDKKLDRFIPQYILEKCRNCSGYGAIGNNPRIICPTCKGLGANRIPVSQEGDSYDRA